jgi:hypothetical protein
MQHTNRWFFAVLVIAGLQMSACQKYDDGQKTEHPAEVEQIEGSALSRVTLTEKAIQRLDLQTDEVRQQANIFVVPYSSLIYDPQGNTWVYTSPQPRTFVRQQVSVDRIEGDLAYLSESPPAGTVIASIGVAELYGAEFEMGH